MLRAEEADTFGAEFDRLRRILRGVRVGPDLENANLIDELHELGIGFVVVEVDIDEDTLTEIATATGGRYFRATDSDSLKRIYETIDALEKSSIDETKIVRYRELAVEPIPCELPLLPPMTLPPVLVMAMLVLAAEIALSTTLLRRLD
jgi:hypothetical protein